MRISPAVNKAAGLRSKNTSDSNLLHGIVGLHDILKILRYDAGQTPGSVRALQYSARGVVLDATQVSPWKRQSEGSAIATPFIIRS